MAASDVQDANISVILDIRALAATIPTIPGATAVAAEDLSADPSRFIESTDADILIVCDMGVRSELSVDLLRAAGYDRAFSLAGGMEAWTGAGLPLDAPEGLSTEEYRRYDRQLKLPDFGVSGQQALGRARVAVVGAGGLGSPVLMYLAAAGVGHLTIIDSDTVEISNLHRQPIYGTRDIGSGKAEAAANFVSELNPSINVAFKALQLDDENATASLRGHDVIVTCTDSFGTAHAINAAAVELAVPLVFGSVYRSEGQLAVFDASRGPCYACVFPSDVDGATLSCSIVGVLGPVTGVIGSMQAGEVVKLLTGIGEPDRERLHLYDARTQSMDSVSIRKIDGCVVCGERSARP